MNNTLKGLLAASGAAFLLLGGAGTLAYWTDASPLSGGSMSSGSLALGDPSCGSGWSLEGQAYTTQEIVPGDDLTKVCTIDLVATGENLEADLAIATPEWTGDEALTSELSSSAVFTVNGETTTEITSEDDNGVGEDAEIRAVITVSFDGEEATNASQNLDAALASVAVTATQTPGS